MLFLQRPAMHFNIETLAGQLDLFEEHGGMCIRRKQRFAWLFAIADVIEGIGNFDALRSCHGTAVFLEREGLPVR